MKRLFRLATSTALAVIPLACGGARAAPPRAPLIPPTRIVPRPPKLAEEQVCRATHDPLDPALEALDAEGRATLRVLARQGLVAVRYFVNGRGAALRVIPGCTADAHYVYQHAPVVHHTLLRTRHKLECALPVGVLSFDWKTPLTLDEYQDGALWLSGVGPSYPASALHGPDCLEATHVVSRIALGAFKLAIFGGEARATGGDLTRTGRQVDASGAPAGAMALGVHLVPIAGVPRDAPACPTGSEWVGAECVPSLGTTCSKGLHHDAKRGCVPDGAQLQSPAALEAWYDAHKDDRADAQRLVRVAYQIGEMRFVGGEEDPVPWWERTVSAFERWRKAGGSADTPEAAMAAEAAYRGWDAAITADFDYSTGHQRYGGTAVGVIKRMREEAVLARKREKALQADVVDASRDPLWTVAAVARQGSLYESLRRGLLHSNPQMFDRHTQLLLAQSSANSALAGKAHEIEVKVREQWRVTVAKEIDGLLPVMVNRYATAIQLAWRYHVDNAVVRRTELRLEELEIELGAAQMQELLKDVPGLHYTPGMFSAP